MNLNGTEYVAAKATAGCVGCQVRDICHVGAKRLLMDTCIKSKTQPFSAIWIKGKSPMNETKINLNNLAQPAKDGLYIIIKRTVANGFVQASNQPHVHHTKEEAQKEAERLAALSPSHEFLVMQAISLSKTTKVETTKFKV